MQRFWAGMMMAMTAVTMASEAGAEELRLGLQSAAGYSSNVFGQTSDPDPGAFYNVRADLSLVGERSRWAYDLSYRPGVNGRGDGSERVAMAHRASGALLYRPDTRTTLQGDTRFSYQQDYRFDLEDEILAPGELPTDAQQEVTRVWNRLALTRRLSPRLSLNGSAGYTTTQFERDASADNIGLTAGMSGSYLIGPRLQVGAGGTFRYRSFEDRLGAADTTSRSTSYELFGSAVYQLAPGLTLTAQAGPAFLSQTQEDNRLLLGQGAQIVGSGLLGAQRFPSGVLPGQLGEIRFIDRATCDLSITNRFPDCSPVVGDTVQVDDSEFQALGIGSAEQAFMRLPLSDFDERSSSFTYFASVELMRQFRQGQVSLRYTRSEQPTAGNASTSVFDELILRASVPLSPRWQLIGFASWLHSEQQQLTPVLVPANVYPSLGITGTSPNNGPGREILVVQRAEVEQQFDADITSWRAAATLQHRFTRRLRIDGRFEFRHRRSDSDLRSAEFDDFRGVISLHYSLDPIRL